MPDLWRRLRSFIFLSDEELGKKDDDHYRSGGGGGGGGGSGGSNGGHMNSTLLRNRSSQWQPAAKLPSRRLLRRLAYIFLIACGLWYLLFDTPFDVSDHQPDSNNSYPDDPRHDHLHDPSRDASSRHTGGRGAESQSLSSGPDHSYNGPVVFLHLADSLHAISATRGGQAINLNVLFAASSLQSASTLLPLACRMGMELRSYVHFAVMSRSDIELDDLKKINGMDDSCNIIWHDARPDFPSTSTDARFELAIGRAMLAINTFMHPQAVIVDGSEQELAPFSKAMRRESGALRIQLIELPANAAKHLPWLPKLDSGSLAAWNQVSVDILIQAPTSGSGCLLRLLKSLSEADLTSFTIPRLTIELPRDVEPAIAKFLDTFRWPPAHVPNPSRVQMLTLRRRIPRQRVTEDETSVRFLESFWPATPSFSHVLVLSPQAELAPGFFQYLKYSLLEYRYSRISMIQKWDQRLLGISMTSPSVHIDGEKDFEEPTSEGPAAGNLGSSYLWQAPNSNAMLFFGDKWTELHSLVAEVDTAQQMRGAESSPELLTSKDVSKMFPSWLEHALRLSRLRGYFTLYPSAETAATVARVHQELYQVPEEYQSGDSERKRVRANLAESIYTTDSSLRTLDTLPSNGSLTMCQDLPILGWKGESTSLQDVYQKAVEYMFAWRELVGGCSGREQIRSDHIDPSMKDLFCTPDGNLRG